MKKSLILAAMFAFASAASAQQVTRIPATDKVLPGRATPVFAVGAEDGEDWELLSRVAGVAFDARDNLYILDGGNSRVLVFDARGKFIRQIGKKGGGPGELLTPVGLAVTKDDYVAVTDLGRPGVSLFKPDGSFVKNLMLGDTLGMPMPQGGTQAHPARGVVVRSMPLMMARGGEDRPASGLAAPTGVRQSPITWLSANAPARKLYSFALPSVTPKVNESGGQSARQVTVRINTPAFQPPVLWSVLPNSSIAFADEAAYRVKLVSDGKVTRIIERAFPVRKATERDRDKARAQRRTAMKTGSGMIVSTREGGPGGSRSTIGTGPGARPRMSNAEIEQQIREMTFLETVPALRAMTKDAKGRLWIERTAREVGVPGPVDIIEPAGRYIGTVHDKIPDAISASGRAAYIERDDMDVERVVVKQLPAAWR